MNTHTNTTDAANTTAARRKAPAPHLFVAVEDLADHLNNLQCTHQLPDNKAFNKAIGELYGAAMLLLRAEEEYFLSNYEVAGGAA
jgi:hypothetical protein